MLALLRSRRGGHRWRAERFFLANDAPNVGVSVIVGHTIFLGVAEVGRKGRDEVQWAEDPEASAVPRLKLVGLVDHGVWVGSIRLRAADAS